MRRLAAIAGLIVVLLAGCSSEPPAESLETAIPAALLASDLGILEASASTGMDGFSKYLSVYVVLDRDSLSTDDLVQIVTLAVENSHSNSIGGMTIAARDGTAEGREYIDVGAVGEQLGFSRSPLVHDDVMIAWEQARALSEEHR